MKLNVLKPLLRGLIASSAVSLALFIAGCGGLNTTAQKINEPFYPEYYAAKKLDGQDIIRLRRYASSLDQKVADPASLILGRYYLKNGDKSYGEFLVEKFYKSSALDPQMKIYGKLWRIEAMMANKNIADAQKEAESFSKIKSDETLIKIMTSYCRQRGFSFQNNDFGYCISQLAVMEAKPSTTPVTEHSMPGIDGNLMPMDNGSMLYGDNMTYEEYAASQFIQELETNTTVTRDAVINIIDGDVDGKFIQGMIYAINKFGANYQINSSAGRDQWSQGNTISIKAKAEELKIGDSVFNMGINWEELIYVATNLQFISQYERVVVAVSTSKLPLGRSIEKTLKSQNKYVKVLNYSNNFFQARLREELERASEMPVLIIGLADDEEILNFVPIAKFLQKDIEKQRIMLVTGFLNDIRENKEYSGYFRDIYVLTPIQGLTNDRIKESSNEYEGFFGVKMDLINMIGYDTIELINSLADGHMANPQYLTNIEAFINYKAYRPVNLYKFDKMLDFTEESPDLSSPFPESEPTTGKSVENTPVTEETQDTVENADNIDVEGGTGAQ